MPRRRADETLEEFLSSQPAEALAGMLLTLAGQHEAVREHLTRWSLAHRPDALAAAFRRTLSGWRRGSRLLDRREAAAFSHALRGWLDDVSRELLPVDPAAALGLFEAAIESDRRFLDRADDSDGDIADALRDACQRWLQAAARCPVPPQGWAQHLLRLSLDDDYGTRESLLGHADTLLDETAMRALVAQFEGLLAAQVARRATDGRLPHEVFKLSAALALLSRALRDPEVHVRATLLYSPDPNPLQRESLVEDFLEAGRPADALRWLEGHWDHHEESRLRLSAEAFEALGRREEWAAARETLFEHQRSVPALHAWLAALPPSAHGTARARARAVALAHDDLAAGAALLLALDDASQAEALLVDGAERIDGTDYPALVPLADGLRRAGRLRAETAVRRALLLAILARGKSLAYGHAADYLARLREISASGAPLAPLPSHAAFEAHLLERHGRKSGFWAQVRQLKA